MMLVIHKLDNMVRFINVFNRKKSMKIKKNIFLIQMKIIFFCNLISFDHRMRMSHEIIL